MGKFIDSGQDLTISTFEQVNLTPVATLFNLTPVATLFLRKNSGEPCVFLRGFFNTVQLGTFNGSKYIYLIMHYQIFICLEIYNTILVVETKKTFEGLKTCGSAYFH